MPMVYSTRAGETPGFLDWTVINFLNFQVQHFSEFIPKAFPSGDDLILDAEVLLVDNNTSKPLPFGTLGVHKVNILYYRYIQLEKL